MVAALQSPPEHRPRRSRPLSAAVPARVVPLHAPGRTRPEHATRLRLVPNPDPVLRPARPRVTRSTTRASVFWRRRLIAAALGLGIVSAAAHAGTALGGSTTTPERRPHVQKVVVHEGDTLWSIAERVAPDADPRELVDEIAAERGTADVRAGEQIEVSI